MMALGGTMFTPDKVKFIELLEAMCSAIAKLLWSISALVACVIALLSSVADSPMPNQNMGDSADVSLVTEETDNVCAIPIPENRIGTCSVTPRQEKKDKKLGPPRCEEHVDREQGPCMSPSEGKNPRVTVVLEDGTTLFFR